MKIGNFEIRKDRIIKQNTYGTQIYFLDKHELKQIKKFLMATEN